MEINTLLYNHWIKREIKGEIRNFLETKENENTTDQNAWNAAKAFLKGKFIALKTPN